MSKKSLSDKVAFAIKLLRSIPQDEGAIELSYSGGKDSDVILELAKMAEIPYRAIYKSTTIDPPGTIAHCQAKNVEIVRPKKSFFELVREKGMPHRNARFCCEVLKEYKILDRAVQGIRRAESNKRAMRYKEPEYCRAYAKKQKARIYMPILDWTDSDVAQFVSERDIKCHPLYYDERGNFCVKRRLGCIGCPIASVKNRRDEYLKYPRFLRASLSNLQVFIDAHPTSKIALFTNNNAHNYFFSQLFLANKMQYENIIRGNNNLFGKEGAINAKIFLEDYFGIDLTI